MTRIEPTLDGALADALDRLQLPATERQQRQLLDLLALLQRWNGTYNLTAIRAPADMLVQHVVDCLAVVQPMDRQLGSDQTAATLLDVGSGAGFPASVIAVMRPAVRVTAVDSVGKKAAFIRQVAGELRIDNLESQHSRVQELTGAYDLIASRALGDLAMLARMTAHLLAPGGRWMAMKGKPPTAETPALAALRLQFHVEQLTVPGLDADRCVVWMRPDKSALAIA